MVCIFCLKETDNSITLYGESDLAKQARNVVTKHFWFDPNEINSIGKYACSYCWSQVESFSDFYGMVVSNYPNFLNVIDETKDLDLVNPSLDDGTASIANEIAVVKVENDELDVYTADYDSDEVSFSSNSVDFKIEIDEMSNILSVEPNDNSDSILLLNHTSKLAKKGDSNTQSGQQTSAKLFCYICRKQFTKNDLRHHMAEHDPKESFTLKCGICGEKFSRKPILRDHLKAHNREARNLRVQENKKFPLKHVCLLCGKGFSAPSLLFKHEISHLDRSVTQVQCDFCGKWQKNENVLQAHRRTHKQAPQKCPHPNCDKLTYNRQEMKIHLSQFHSHHKHQCSICKRSFAQPIQLRAHMSSTHTDERAFKCSYCTKDFKTHSAKYKHVKDHHPRE